jgi:hypothetical protein
MPNCGVAGHSAKSPASTMTGSCPAMVSRQLPIVIAAKAGRPNSEYSTAHAPAAHLRANQSD